MNDNNNSRSIAQYIPTCTFLECFLWFAVSGDRLRSLPSKTVALSRTCAVPSPSYWARPIKQNVQQLRVLHLNSEQHV